MNHDAKMIECVKAVPHSSISWLLMASFLYYHRPECTPILSDEKFDILCRKVQQGFDRLQHQHKHLITPEDLAAGSLFALPRDEYPTVCMSAAVQLSRELT